MEEPVFEVEEVKEVEPDALIDVRIVRVQGESALVEYVRNGALCRSIIPFWEIADGRVFASVLSAGIRYGLPWAEMIDPAATSAAIEAALYKAGIWTGEDLRKGTRAALGALQSVYGTDLAALLNAVQELEQ